MAKRAATTEVPLDRDVFFRTLLRNLTGTLEDTVGLKLAEGYISSVGGQVGRWIDREYRQEMGTEQLTREQIAEVCIDLKTRIGGDFHLIAADKHKLVFGNRRCPFGDMVRDRPSLCMMTSNVFGRIAADNLGYARVQLAETIATGHAGCRVIVHLTPSRAETANAREYYRISEEDTDAGGRD
ncbi:methanogen output domain 1-containing protein [Marinovum sp.]|uniref:methanogen output domain 1-containing protein n=1 Tax=Marinovum sp. TaxID=2024839 RepID=UPI002B26E295|nr:methanogen output domain 1-containing protein [Marinovum sp.]